MRLSSCSRSFSLPLLAVLGVVASCATGCGGGSTPPASASSDDGGFVPSSILDEYEATGEIPDTAGFITKIAFLDETNYALKKTTGSLDGEQIEPEWGTYVVDAAAGTLTLTDGSTGAVRSLPFQATPSGAAEDLHVLGSSLASGGTQLTFTISCTLTINSQSFQALNISCSIGGPGSSSGSGAGGAGSGAGSTGPGSTGPGSSGPGSTGSSPGSGPGSTGPTGGSDAGGTSLTSSGMDGGIALTSASGQGIDVSHWDGTINWAEVKTTGKSFAYTKATEGATYTDNTFKTNYAGIQAQGMKRGGYHFFQSSANATTQANHFVSVLKAGGFNAQTDLPPALDLEAAPGLSTSSQAGVKTFIQVVQQQLGVTVTIYTDSGDWAKLGNPNMSTNPLWIAYVNKGGAMSTASSPRMPPGWSSYTIWQNSWVGQIKGINAKVDTDYAPLVAGSN